MEVKINREIRNYTESMFFGLSMRQFFFSVAAMGVAVLLYFLLKPHFGTETVSWMCILGSVCRHGFYYLSRDDGGKVSLGLAQIRNAGAQTAEIRIGQLLLRGDEGPHRRS